MANFRAFTTGGQRGDQFTLAFSLKNLDRLTQVQ
jgi:hypothetical protein